MKSRLLTLFLLLVMILPCAAGEESGVFVKEGTVGTVTVQGAALRSEPTKAVPLLLSLDDGAEVIISEMLSNAEGSWFKVSCNNRNRVYEGFILADFVSAELVDEDGNAIRVPAKLRVRAEAKCVGGYNHVGYNWAYEFCLNGDVLTGSKAFTFTAGDTLRLSGSITENDTYPDTGSFSQSHTLTQTELDRGFSLSFDVYVSENRGRYSGRSCRWQVTYYFTKA